MYVEVIAFSKDLYVNKILKGTLGLEDECVKIGVNHEESISCSHEYLTKHCSMSPFKLFFERRKTQLVFNFYFAKTSQIAPVIIMYSKNSHLGYFYSNRYLWTFTFPLI